MSPNLQARLPSLVICYVCIIVCVPTSEPRTEFFCVLHLYGVRARTADIIGISSMVIPSLLPLFLELCSSERAKWELYVDSTLHTYLLNE